MNKMMSREEWRRRLELAAMAGEVLHGDGIAAEVEPEDGKDREVSVEISGGDWKHGHARSRFLMAEIGFELVDSEITDEDGSDCYSAVWYYRMKI